MILYYAPLTRAMRPHWMLEELGVPYEIVRVDLGQREHKSEAFLRLNPMGRVPVLVDEGQAYFESAAICMHLSDRFPERGLAPSIGSPARGIYYQWILCAMTELEPAIKNAFRHSAQLPPEQRSLSALEEAKNRVQEVASAIQGPLGQTPYLLPDGFSAADIMMGELLVAARRFGILAGMGPVEGYVDLISSRPAFKRARALSFAGHDHD